MIGFELTEDQKQLQDLARKFAKATKTEEKTPIRLVAPSFSM